MVAFNHEQNFHNRYQLPAHLRFNPISAGRWVWFFFLLLVAITRSLRIYNGRPLITNFSLPSFHLLSVWHLAFKHQIRMTEKFKCARFWFHVCIRTRQTLDWLTIQNMLMDFTAMSGDECAEYMRIGRVTGSAMGSEGNLQSQSVIIKCHQLPYRLPSISYWLFIRKYNKRALRARDDKLQIDFPIVAKRTVIGA